MLDSRLIWVLVLVFVFQACSTSLNTTQLSEKAKLEYSAGNYDSSLLLWEQIIADSKSKGKEVGGEIYSKAAIAALSAGNTDKSMGYFDQARYADYASPEMYQGMASLYKNIDNLSKEIMALEDYVTKFPESPEINKVSARLFETYVESENWDLAIDLWQKLDENNTSDPLFIDGYLKSNIALEKSETSDLLAKQLLEINDSNLTALEWFATKYYYQAENRYQAEMKAYNKKKTNSRYKKLLKALDIINADFKVSLKHFNKLYSLNPLPEYALYLGNIYGRFDDKKKSAYYLKLAKSKQ